MTNRVRGEVPIKIGGKSYDVALTLGVLAELEDRFKTDSFEKALKIAFQDKKMSASALQKFICATLTGNGINLDSELTNAINKLTLAEVTEITLQITEMIQKAGPSKENNGANSPL